MIRNLSINPNRQHACRGFSIVETLVAISLIGIAMAGTASLIANGMLGNSTVRKQANLINDVQSRMDGYRQQSFSSLVTLIGSPASSVANNQSVTLTTTSNRITYITTLTAIKANSSGVPQAVRVQVQATQGRGRLKNASYSFETLVANVS